MKYILFTISIFCITGFFTAQSTLNTQHIIELGKYYSEYMLSQEPSEEFNAKFATDFENDLQQATAFIKETVTKKNEILTDKFLKVPDSTTLKIIYIIGKLHQNPHLKSPKDPVKLVDSLKIAQIPMQELLDQYYQIIFASVGNKNLPFNLSKIDFNLNTYGLENDQYRGIFYLTCMEMCGNQIFGYMNIVNPPNTKKALSYIKKYPKFNGEPYYKYKNFEFDDFQMEILNDQGEESYKSYFITKLYSTLLSHLVCLKKENKSDKDINDLLLNSILNEESFYEFTVQKDLLESIRDGKEPKK